MGDAGVQVKTFQEADPARPVRVILGPVLHFLDADAARAVTAGYARLMAPGSCLVISVASFDDEGLGMRVSLRGGGISGIRAGQPSRQGRCGA